MEYFFDENSVVSSKVILRYMVSTFHHDRIKEKVNNRLVTWFSGDISRFLEVFPEYKDFLANVKEEKISRRRLNFS